MNRNQRITVVLSLLGALLLSAVPVDAQDASPAASPLASPGTGACRAPALLPGTPTPPEATPSTEAGGMAPGTPESEAATPPAASPVPAGSPAGDATTEEVLAWVDNYAACVNEGNAEAVFVLLTDRFLQTTFGLPTIYDVIANVSFWPMTIEEAGDVQTHPDGHVSIDLTYTGLDGPPTQLTHDRWFLIEDGGTLKLDVSQNLPLDDADVTVMVDPVACTLSEQTAGVGETVAFTVRNDGPHIAGIDVYALPEGVTLEQVREDGDLFDQAFRGWVFVAPGTTAYRGLIDLDPGAYTIDCWQWGPEGESPAGHETVAEFTVQ